MPTPNQTTPDSPERVPEINTSRRLFDLVRHQRSELHQADLISDDEYAWLCTYEFKEDKGKPGSPSPRRLEDYDQLRAETTRLAEALKEIERLTRCPTPMMNTIQHVAKDALLTQPAPHFRGEEGVT